MLARHASLLLVLVCSACSTRGIQERHRLYLTEPDLVRDKRIDIGMTEDAVSKKLGKPTASMTNTVNGKEISDWEYAIVTRPWTPRGEDTGFYDTHGTEVAVSAQPRIDLLFIDGTLVAIADYRNRTFNASPAALGDTISAEEVARFRDRASRKGTD